MREAREDDNFVETDLRLWTDKLQELKIDIADIYLTVIIHKDPSMKLIDKLNITSIIQQPEVDENLVRICESVQIEDNGHVAVQQGSRISYACGKNEYSFGKYKIRFNVNKTKLDFNTNFGIISKMEILYSRVAIVILWMV